MRLITETLSAAPARFSGIVCGRERYRTRSIRDRRRGGTFRFLPWSGCAGVSLGVELRFVRDCLLRFLWQANRNGTPNVRIARRTTSVGGSEVAGTVSVGNCSRRHWDFSRNLVAGEAQSERFAMRLLLRTSTGNANSLLTMGSSTGTGLFLWIPAHGFPYTETQQCPLYRFSVTARQA